MSTHRPVYLPREDYPGAIAQVGCTCGHKPVKANLRAATMMASYNRHLTKVGAPRTATEPTYASGPYAGMTWDQMNQARQAAL